MAESLDSSAQGAPVSVTVRALSVRTSETGATDVNSGPVELLLALSVRSEPLEANTAATVGSMPERYKSHWDALTGTPRPEPKRAPLGVTAVSDTPYAALTYCAALGVRNAHKSAASAVVSLVSTTLTGGGALESGENDGGEEGGTRGGTTPW